MKSFLIFICVFSCTLAKASYQDKCDPNVLSADSNRPQLERIDCNSNGLYLKEVIRGVSADNFGNFLQQAGASVLTDNDPESNLPPLTLISFDFLECSKPVFGKDHCHAEFNNNISGDDAKSLVKFLQNAGITKNSNGLYAGDVLCIFSETALCRVTAVP